MNTFTSSRPTLWLKSSRNCSGGWRGLVGRFSYYIKIFCQIYFIKIYIWKRGKPKSATHRRMLMPIWFHSLIILPGSAARAAALKYYDIHRCPFHEIRGNWWENPCPRCPDLQGGLHQCLGCLPPVLIDMLRSAEPFSNWKSCGAQPSIVYHHLSSSPVVSTMHLQGLAISCVGASFGLAMTFFFSSWVHPGSKISPIWMVSATFWSGESLVEFGCMRGLPVPGHKLQAHGWTIPFDSYQVSATLKLHAAAHGAQPFTFKYVASNPWRTLSS